MTFKIIEEPSKKSTGKAIVNGKIYHYIYHPIYKKKKWIICGDCNKLR